jgi:hypothetical protein
MYYLKIQINIYYIMKLLILKMVNNNSIVNFILFIDLSTIITKTIIFNIFIVHNNNN